MVTRGTHFANALATLMVIFPSLITRWVTRGSNELLNSAQPRKEQIFETIILSKVLSGVTVFCFVCVGQLGVRSEGASELACSCGLEQHLLSILVFAIP